MQKVCPGKNGVFVLEQSQGMAKRGEMCIAVALERVPDHGISNIPIIQCDFNTPPTKRWVSKSPPLETGLLL